MAAEADCSVHGRQGIGLVCTHIAHAVDSGKNVGFYWGDDTDTARPVAWCYACEQARLSVPEGQATDQWFLSCDYKIFCAACWDYAKWVLYESRQASAQESAFGLGPEGTLMENDAALSLLFEIEKSLNLHGGDLEGATHLEGEVLSIFDGRVRLRAQVDPVDTEKSLLMVHAHLIAELQGHDDEPLDACLVGVGEDLESGLKEIARQWLMSIAELIRSLLDGHEVSSAIAIRPGSDCGLEGVEGYLGPFNIRGDMTEEIERQLEEQHWFCNAVAAASPRRLHLAKVFVQGHGSEGWTRHLELDGHDASLRDSTWAARVPAPPGLYVSRFAVFRFPEDSPEPELRRELERAIRFLAFNLSRYEKTELLQAAMVEEGFDPDLANEVECFGTLAFGRYYLSNQDVHYPATVIRARRQGKIEEVPLMSLPAFNRAFALAKEIQEQLPREHFLGLCFYAAESQVILNALKNGIQDLSNLVLAPCVVPDRGVDDKTFEAAMAIMDRRVQSFKPKKPWWKLW